MIDRYYEGSRLYSAVRDWNGSGHPLHRGYRSSRLKRVVDRLGRAVDWSVSVAQQSLLVRWLTAEPEPDVVVIDLRETLTIGPLIAVLDRLLPHGERAWNASGIRQVLRRTATAFADAPVQFTSAIVLALLVAQFAFIYGAASRLSLGLLALLAAPALLGLRVTSTWDELAESRAGQFAAALFVPPDPPTDEN
jgi:hypothetical protein